MTRPVTLIEENAAAASLLHPLRFQILEHLVEPSSATAVARELGLPRQKVNYHLRELESAGLVEEVEQRRKGNCVERIVRATAIYYVVAPQILRSLGDTPPEAQDRFSSTYLLAVACEAIRDLAIIRERATRSGRRVATLTTQFEIRFRNAAERAAFAQELLDAIATLTSKYHDDDSPGGHRFRFFAGGYPAVSKMTKKESEATDVR